MKRFCVIILCMVVALNTVGCTGNFNKENALKDIKFPSKPPVDKLYDSEITGDSTKWGELGTHDPSIFKDGDTYYVFSTDARVGGAPTPGIQVRKSKDLINWDYIGVAFDKGVPSIAAAWANATGLWAPDVTRIGDNYYLYYAASSFGSNKSFIGVATSKAIEGPWVDQGEVIKTDTGDTMNAIDPNIVYDEQGDMWLSYGSFWSGIYVLKMDKATGKPAEAGKGKNISRRNSSVSGAVEGPYITYNTTYKKYYLFVSYGSLSSDYNVRVGRSDKVDGPYLDSQGNDMTNTTVEPNQVGNKIMGGYKFGDTEGWIAPGHNSVLKDGKDFYIVHHIRAVTDSSWFYMNVRKILWSKDGWPMVSPEKYAGDKEQKIDKAVIPGQWDKIILSNAYNDQISSDNLKLLPNGKVEGDAKSNWKFSGNNILSLSLYDDKENKASEFNCKVIAAWDAENNKPNLVFTGMDDKGTSICGKMVK